MKKFLTLIVAALMSVTCIFGLAACNKEPSVKLKVLDIKLTEESYAFAVNKGNSELLTSIDTYLSTIKDNGTFQTILDKYLEGNGEKSGSPLGTYDANKEQVVVLTNTPFEPFEYTSGGLYYGIDIEIAAGYATSVGKELCIIEWPEFDTILNQFNTYPNAIVMAGLTADADRAQIVDFTQSYFETSQKLIIKENDTTFKDCTTKEQVDAVLAELVGKKIGYQNGTQGGYYLESFENIIPSGFKTAALAAQALKNGSIDFVIVDEAPAAAIVVKSNQLG